MADHKGFNGNEFELGTILGEMVGLQRQQVSLLEDIRGHVSMKSSREPKISSHIAAVRELLQDLYPVLKVSLALIFLFGLITKQVTWADLPAIVTMAMGH